MNRQDASTQSTPYDQPASTRQWAEPVLSANSFLEQTSTHVKNLASEVLALCQHTREQNMHYLLQLADTRHGPDIRLMDSSSGLPINDMAQDIVSGLAFLPPK